MCMRGSSSRRRLNGAGKTTLFNTISGSCQYSGEIIRGGEKLQWHEPGTQSAQRHRAVAEGPRTHGKLFGRDRPVRKNPRPRGQQMTDELERNHANFAWLFDLFPITEERQAQIGADAERRRTSRNAGDPAAR